MNFSKTKFILIISLLFYGDIAFAQLPLFQKQFDVFHNSEGLAQSISLDSGYVLFGSGADVNAQDSTRFNKAFIIGTDLWGNEKWRETIFKNYHNSGFSITSPSKISDTVFETLIGINDTTSYFPKTYLVRFDVKNHDTIQMRPVNMNTDTVTIRTYTRLKNGDYVFVAKQVASIQQYNNLILMRCDSNLNRIWYKEYSWDGLAMPLSVTFTANNQILVSGHKYDSLWIGFFDYSWLMRLDMQGNIIYEKQYGVSPIFSYSYNLELPSGNILLYGEGRNSVTTRAASISKVTANGDSLWSRTYSNIDPIWGVQPTAGNTFVFTASARLPSYGNQVGTIFKTDSNGNILWQRYYYTSYHDHYLNSIKHTIDGKGFLMTGICLDTTAVKGAQNGWLIVADSFGCIQPGCQLHDLVQEINPFKKSDYLTVFPNPFTNQTTVKYTLPEYLVDAEILLMNSDGKIINTHEIKNQHNGKVEINCSECAEGNYYIMLKANGRLQESKKVVLNKQ